MRIVLDTNVLISALIRDGKPREFLDLLLAEHHTLILSRPIIEEFSRVAADQRIRPYTDSEEVVRFLRKLVAEASLVSLTSRFKVLNTPDDLVLRTAHDGKAHMIVTGDKHLLELASFKGFKILTVSEAMQYL